MASFYRILPLFLVFSFSGHAQNSPEVDTKPKALPETIGEQISSHIDNLARAERDKRMDFMHIVIDDITRLCELQRDQKKQLRLAAEGSAERSMKDWNEEAERYFRSRVNGAKPDTAKQILSNIGNINFGNRKSDHHGEIQKLWKDALKKILNEPQIKTYEKTIAERKQARVEAFSEMAIASLDNFLRLTPEQKSKIAPIVRDSANENLDEVRSSWGDYLEKNMLMSLINIADKKTLTSILSDKQYERLKTATVNLDHFWEKRRKIKEARANGEKIEEGDDDDAGRVILGRPNIGHGRVPNIQINF